MVLTVIYMVVVSSVVISCQLVVISCKLVIAI